MLGFRVRGPEYESKSYGFVQNVDAAAILGEGVLQLFLVNRSQVDSARVEINPAGMRLKSVQSAEVVSGSSPDARNTFEHPNTIRNEPYHGVELSEGKASLELPPLSVAAISFTIEESY